MPKTTTTDPVTEAAALRERGAAALAQIRREADERRAQLEEIDREEAAKLEAAEREFGATLATQEAEAHRAVAQAAYDEAAAHAAQLTAEADRLLAPLLEDVRDLVDRFVVAVDAEKRRVDALQPLHLRRAQLARPGEYVEPYRPQAHRLLIHRDWTNPLTALAYIAVRTRRDNPNVREVRVTAPPMN